MVDSPGCHVGNILGGDAQSNVLEHNSENSLKSNLRRNSLGRSFIHCLNGTTEINSEVSPENHAKCQLNSFANTPHKTLQGNNADTTLDEKLDTNLGSNIDFDKHLHHGWGGSQALNHCNPAMQQTSHINLPIYLNDLNNDDMKHDRSRTFDQDLSHDMNCDLNQSFYHHSNQGLNNHLEQPKQSPQTSSTSYLHLNNSCHSRSNIKQRPYHDPKQESFFLDNIIVGYAFGPKKMETMGIIMAEASKALSTFENMTIHGISDEHNENIAHDGATNDVENIQDVVHDHSLNIVPDGAQDQFSMQLSDEASMTTTAATSMTTSKYHNNFQLTDYNNNENSNHDILKSQSKEQGKHYFSDDDNDEVKSWSSSFSARSSLYSQQNHHQIQPNQKRRNSGIQLTFMPDLSGFIQFVSTSSSSCSLPSTTTTVGTSIVSASTSTSTAAPNQQMDTDSVMNTDTKTASDTNPIMGTNLDSAEERRMKQKPIRVSFVPIDLDTPLQEQHGGKFDVILHKMTEDILCISKMLRSNQQHCGEDIGMTANDSKTYTEEKWQTNTLRENVNAKENVEEGNIQSQTPNNNNEDGGKILFMDGMMTDGPSKDTRKKTARNDSPTCLRREPREQIKCNDGIRDNGGCYDYNSSKKIREEEEGPPWRKYLAHSNDRSSAAFLSNYYHYQEMMETTIKRNAAHTYHVENISNNNCVSNYCLPDRLFSTPMSRHQTRAAQRIQRLREYKQTVHPSCVLIDPPSNVLAIMSRADMAQVLSSCLKGVNTKSGIPVRTPRFRVVEEGEEQFLLPRNNSATSTNMDCGDNSTINKYDTSPKTSLAEQIDRDGFQYPLIAKPLTAAGTKSSHHMGIVMARYGLKRLKTPCLLQEYANHGGALFKVYVLGDSVWVFKRESLPNLPTGERRLNFNFNDNADELMDDTKSRSPPSSLFGKRESYVEFERPAGSRSYVEFDSQRPYPKLSDFGLGYTDIQPSNALHHDCHCDDEKGEKFHGSDAMNSDIIADNSTSELDKPRGIESDASFTSPCSKKQRVHLNDYHQSGILSPSHSDVLRYDHYHHDHEDQEHNQYKQLHQMSSCKENSDKDNVEAGLKMIESSKSYAPSDLASYVTADEIEPVTIALRKAFGLQLFGFDVLVKHDDKCVQYCDNKGSCVADSACDEVHHCDADDGDYDHTMASQGTNHYDKNHVRHQQEHKLKHDPKTEILIVDVNYFPGYKEVSNFPSLLAQYLMQKALESRMKNFVVPASPSSNFFSSR